MIITLLDGEHDLKPATFYALELMSDYGVDFEGDDLKPRNISGMLAALLTDSEPIVDGEPAKVWTPTMAAKLIDPATVAPLVESLAGLLNDGLPEPSGDTTERPTNARSGLQ